MKLNDLISFIRFSLNGSPPPPPPPPPPPIKTSGPINRLSLFSNKCTLPIDRQNLSMQLSHATDTKLHRLLNFKTRTVTE